MYYGGNSNENFQVQVIDRCNGFGMVTGSCPFTGKSIDQSFLGSPSWLTVQIKYMPLNGECVALSCMESGGNPGTGVNLAYQGSLNITHWKPSS